jgi:hypothetical protein
MHPQNNHKGSFSTRRAQLRNYAKKLIVDYFDCPYWQGIPPPWICKHLNLTTYRERITFGKELQKIIKRIDKSITEI